MAEEKDYKGELISKLLNRPTFSNDIGVDGLHPKATRLVGRWSTKCNNCGRDSDLSSAHNKILGYGSNNGELGCGIVYEFELDEYDWNRGLIRLGEEYETSESDN